MDVLKKLSSGANGSFWALQMGCPHNLRTGLRIFLKFCSIKGTEKYMEIILMVSLKKFSNNANGPFWV